MARWRDMPSAGRRVQQLTDNRLLVGECVTKVGKAILAAIVLTDWGTVRGCRSPRGSAGQPFVVYADTRRRRRNRPRALKVMIVGGLCVGGGGSKRERERESQLQAPPPYCVWMQNCV